MDAAEEIEMEKEALEAIYGEDDYTGTDEGCVVLLHSQSEDGAAYPVPPLRISCVFELPSGYPEEAGPIVTLGDARGMKPEHVLDLVSTAEAAAEENKGEPCIFAVASAVKEAMDELILSFEAASAAKDAPPPPTAAELAAMKAAEEAELRRGTIITPEAFANWRAEFDKEREAAAKELEAAAGSTGGDKKRRLTGRELFEGDKSLVDSDAAFIEEGAVVDDMAGRVAVEEVMALQDGSGGDGGDGNDAVEE